MGEKIKKERMEKIGYMFECTDTLLFRKPLDKLKAR